MKFYGPIIWCTELRCNFSSLELFSAKLPYDGRLIHRMHNQPGMYHLKNRYRKKKTQNEIRCIQISFAYQQQPIEEAPQSLEEAKLCPNLKPKHDSIHLVSPFLAS